MLYENVLEAVGHTPLVRLNRLGKGLAPVLAGKLEFTNPGGSVKDRIALEMVEAAEREGHLKPGGTIIEGTSGNTGMGLAMVAAVKGYKCIFTMPDKMSQEKINALRGLGAEVIVTPTAVAHDDPRSYHEVALRLNREIPNSFFPNQYDNPANPLAHYKTTAPEIWEQTEGRVTHLVIGVGTGGTITGVGRWFREHQPHVKIIGVDPVGSIFYDLFRGREPEPSVYKVEGVGQDELPRNVDFSVIDDIVLVSDKEAFNTTRTLARAEGIFGGGSSGMAVHAALELARGSGAEAYIVALLPDSGYKYLSKIYNDAWMKEHQFYEPPVHLTSGQIVGRKHGGQPPLIAVSGDTTIGEAVELLHRHGISQLPVMAEGRCLGRLDEGRLLQLLLANADARDHSVLEFMEAPFPEVEATMPVEDVADLLSERMQAVLVRGTAGDLAILTKSDMVYALLRAESAAAP